MQGGRQAAYRRLSRSYTTRPTSSSPRATRRRTRGWQGQRRPRSSLPGGGESTAWG